MDVDRLAVKVEHIKKTPTGASVKSLANVFRLIRINFVLMKYIVVN